MPATNTNDRIERFRAQFTSAPNLIHLNNAGQSPMCRASCDAITSWAQRFCLEGAHVFMPLITAVEESRKGLAAFLGCQASELTFFPGAAAAISQVALGLKFNPGDEIIIWDQEYPSNGYPWKAAADRSGAKLIVAPSNADLSTPMETIEKLVTPHTRLIATSWVQFRTGAIMDLKALTDFARPRGIFTCADIIQGAGCLPFDFAALGLDAACGGSHKWMVSAHGAGFMILKQEHFANVAPLSVGAMTYGTPDDPVDLNAQPKRDPKRFEPGGMAFLEVLALGAATKLLADVGIARLSQEAEWLAKRLMHGLREHGYVINSPHGAQFRGAIVNFSPGPNSPVKSQTEIEARLGRINVAYGRRKPGIRLSPHAMNTIEDIERVLKALSA